MPIGRPRKLSPDKLALAERMRAGGEPVPVIAQTLRVSTPTMYRLLAERSKATPHNCSTTSAPPEGPKDPFRDEVGSAIFNRRYRAEGSGDVDVVVGIRSARLPEYG